MNDCLFYWEIGRLVDWLIDLNVVGLIDGMIDCLFGG